MPAIRAQAIQRRLRRDAEAFFRAGVRTVMPEPAMREALRRRNPPLPDAPGRLFLIAVGKAAGGMLAGARGYLEERRYAQAPICFLATDHGNFAPVPECRAYACGHPLPDADGLRAATHLRGLLADMKAEDFVLLLLSGGGSAMLPCPPEGVSLDDEIAMHRLLLSAGVPIGESNLLRQQFSCLKGGGLARLAHPARVLCLLLSDVPGDAIQIIASGPAAAPLGCARDAMEMCRQYGIWEDMPAPMRACLQADLDAPPPPPPENVEHVLIGNNTAMVSVIATAARESGYEVECVSGWVDGEVGALARQLQSRAQGWEAPASASGWVCGGESVVKVRGQGRGGRNQELALRFAVEMTQREAAPWVFLSGGSDGRDGPTDAAGGIVDGGTCARVAAAGLAVDALLADNDSYRALEASGDLLRTGATGTNVADAQIFLAAPA